MEVTELGMVTVCSPLNPLQQKEGILSISSLNSNDVMLLKPLNELSVDVQDLAFHLTVVKLVQPPKADLPL